MPPADLIEVILACQECDEVLCSPLLLNDAWGIEVPEGTTDEYAWLRMISGEPFAARREGSSRGTPFGGHGPRTDRYGPVFWEYKGTSRCGSVARGATPHQSGGSTDC